MVEDQLTENCTPEENQIIRLLDADRNYKVTRSGWRGYHRSTKALIEAANQRSVAIIDALKETHLSNFPHIEIFIDGTFNKLKIIAPSVESAGFSRPSIIKINISQLEAIDPNIRTYLPRTN